MTDEIRPTEPPAQLTPAPRRSLTWLWVLIAITVTAGITYAVTAPSTEPTTDASPSTVATTSPSQDPEDYAIERCREEVTEQLKAPATAQFPGGETVSVSTDYVYSVKGEVDSENGFGAMIRSTFLCDYNAAGGTFEIFIF